MIITLGDIDAKNRSGHIMILDNNAKKNILFIGSCRITAYVNYFLNDEYFGKNYNYVCILVHIPAMVELSKNIVDNDTVKQLICNSSILIKEYVKNYSYFNTIISEAENIYKIYNSFDYTALIPNYDNFLFYTRDILMYGNTEIKSIFNSYINNEIHIDILSEKMQAIHKKELERFYTIIRQTDVTDLKSFVENNIQKRRLGHTLNHSSNILSLEIYRLVQKNIFNRDIPESIIELNNKSEFLGSDDYKSRYTYYDKHILNIILDEPMYDKEVSNKYILSNDIFFKP